MPFGFPRVEKFGISLAALAALALGLALAIGGTAARADEAVEVRLFGSSENTNSDISPFPKWTGALQRYESERQLEDQPCTGPCPLQHWKAFVTSLAGKSRMQQLEAVNTYVNRTPYQADSARYNVNDYWATPREFLGQSGDCEDYVLAKYLSLRKLGWQASDLRLVVLQDETRRELHAVLVAFHNGTAYVLDNLSPRVIEHSTISNYRPIFSINETAWHFHRDWNPTTAVAVARASAPVSTPALVPSRTAPARGAQLAALPAPPAPAQAAPAQAVSPAPAPAIASVAPIAAAPAAMPSRPAPESIAGLFGNGDMYC